MKNNRGNVDAMSELRDSFEAALADPREERVQQFLAQNPGILLDAFGHPWTVNQCIPKLKLGLEFVTDFVIVTGQSYSYDIILVELEPPDARPFTAGGKYARRANDALGQINDWFSWLEINHAYFLTSVANALDSIYGTSQLGGSFGAKRKIFISAKIIIGRRDMLSEEDNGRRTALYASTGKRIEIVPYDRLLDIVIRREADAAVRRDVD